MQLCFFETWQGSPFYKKMNKELVDDLFALLKTDQKESALDIILSNSLNPLIIPYIAPSHIHSLLPITEKKSVDALTNFSSVFELVRAFDQEAIDFMCKNISLYNAVICNLTAQAESEELFQSHLPAFLSAADTLSILINLSRFDRVRAFLFVHQDKLAPLYFHPDFVLLLMNLLLDVEKHPSLPLTQIIELIVSTLYRAIVREDSRFSDEELQHLDVLQYPQVECRHAHACFHCLIAMGTTLEGRQQLRDVRPLYPTVREYHKQCDSEDIIADIEILVGYLIRDEEPLQD